MKLDLTQDELADAVSRLRWLEKPDAPPITSQMVSRWEHGRRPHRVHRRLVAEALGVDLRELGWRGGAQGLPTVPEQKYDDPKEDSNTRRRTFVIGAAAMSAELMADPMLTALRHLRSLDGSLGTTADGLESMAAELVRVYLGEPIGRTQVRASEVLTTARELLDGGVPARLRSTLHSVAGWSAGLVAATLYDLGDSAAGMANTTLALQYAKRAGDGLLQAWLRASRSDEVRDEGRLNDALVLIRQGLATAPDRTGVRLRLHAAEADLLGRLGYHSDARTAAARLPDAYGLLDGAEVGEDAFLLVSVGYVEASLGRVALAVGDLDSAEPHLRAVIERYSSARGRDRQPARLANAQLNLATVLMRLGQADEAVSTVEQILSSERLTAPRLNRMGAFLADLDEHWPQLPEGRHLHERYLSLAVPR